MPSDSNPAQTVNLDSLSLQQLGSVKKQLDDEVEHLTSSFSKLKAAQNKFRDCINLVSDGIQPDMAEKPILVPLTTSLYVPGLLASSSKVIVDVGTGFYVEKSTKAAAQFYSEKINDLEKNLKDLEQIVQGKSSNLRVVENVLRQKVLDNNTNLSSTT